MNEPTRSPAYVFDGFRLDTQRRVLFGVDGGPIALTPRLFDALLYFVEHTGQLLTKDQLLEAIWPNVIVEEHNLNKTVSELRRALSEQPGEHKFIVTQPGRGYRFVADVRVAEPRVGESRIVTAISPHRSASTRYLSAAIVLLGLGLLGALAISWHADEPPGAVTRITPLTAESGDEVEPSWAPDGTRVVFSWNGRLYITQLGTTSPLRLTQPSTGRDVSPAWSPDGRRIAFLRQHDRTRSDLVVVDSLGTSERVLRSVATQDLVDRESAPLLAWTPDSRQLLFTMRREAVAAAETYDFHRLDLETGETNAFAPMSEPGHKDSAPAFSADGRRLAFVRYGHAQRLSVLMVQELGPGYVPVGSPRAVPGVPSGLQHSPSWSPDGTRLLFVTDRDRHLYEWRDGEDARVVFATPLAVTALAISWAGDRLHGVGSFGDFDLDIWSLRLDPRTHEARGPPTPRFLSTAGERHMAFSHDPSRIVFVSARTGTGELYLAEGNGVRQLTALGAQITGFPRWSPDDRSIAFQATSQDEGNVLYIVDVDAPVPRRMFHGIPFDWSRDYLYYGNLQDGMLMRMRTSDGEHERLFPGAMAAETIDGTTLLYTKPGGRGIFARALAGHPPDNPEELLVDDYKLARAAIVPVSDGFYYLGHTPDDLPRAFKFYDYSTRTAKPIWPAPRDTDIGMSISPDGTELLFAAGSGRSRDLAVLEFGDFPAQ